MCKLVYTSLHMYVVQAVGAATSPARRPSTVRSRRDHWDLKSKIDRIWDAFWSGGISNPLEVIEQITYLLFIRRLDDIQTAAENKARRLGQAVTDPIFLPGKADLRWSRFKDFEPGVMHRVIADEVFPFLRDLGGDGSTYSEHMKDARFTIPTPALLSRVVDMLGDVPMQDRDTNGDLYEYMLSKIASAGQNGQFRTPRHIIELMVALTAPQPTDEICDPAAGTCGFLVSAAEYVRREHPSVMTDEVQRQHFHRSMFHGYDFDSTMLRIGSMNMLLHGIERPDVRYRDSLAEGSVGEEGQYSLLLANPPFARSLDYESTSKDLQRVVKTKKTELLFLALFLRLLKPGGRAAVIVPDGVLFGSSKAHKELRRILIEEQKLDAVIKLPPGVFRPYAGVSTAILIFTKTNSGGTDYVWLYDVQADGWSLDDKRSQLLPVDQLGAVPRDEHSVAVAFDPTNHAKNNLPEVLARWVERDGDERKRARTEQSFCVRKAESEQEKDDWDTLDWDEDGDPPDVVTAEELNRFLFNAYTVDKVLQTLMERGHRVASGDRLGKTIIFAKNQKHAEFIAQRFDANYPEHAGHFARVITHSVAYAQSLIDDFSVKDKAPHIAISVDMLDTGIDVPEVVNLVFFKLVRSSSKFWQMIGRGTRLCADLFGPGRDKTNFFVLDFCGNLEFFSQGLAGSEGSLQKSLAQRLFEARLALVSGLDAVGSSWADDPEVGHGEESERGVRVDAAATLHEIVAAMNVDNFLVRPAREWVETYAEWPAWQRVTREDAGAIAHHLGGLPSARRDDDEDAKRFDLVVLTAQLAVLEGDALAFEGARERVQAIAVALLSQTAIPSVKAQERLLDELAGDDWWVDVTLPMLELARRRVRGLVRFVDKTRRAVVYADFEDEMGEASLIDLPGVTPGTNWERFRAKARAYLRDHEDHLALQRLRRNLQLTPEDLLSLEDMLVSSGAGTAADIARASEESHGLGLFIRSLVGLDREAATVAFDGYLSDTTLTTAQLRFVQMIVEQLTANGVMEVARLYESPFTDTAPQGPESLFAEAQIDAVVTVLAEVRNRALVTAAEHPMEADGVWRVDPTADSAGF